MTTGDFDAPVDLSFKMTDPSALREIPAHSIAEMPDILVLQEDLARVLGEDVAVRIIHPTQLAPGWITVHSVADGTEIPVSVDAMAQVLEWNAPPETSDEVFAREYDSAESIEGKLDAVRAWAGRRIEEQRRAEHQQREVLKDLVPPSDTPPAPPNLKQLMADKRLPIDFIPPHLRAYVL